jgi:hypothetical protein
MSALVALGRQGASLFNEGEIADAISATVTKRSEVVDLVLTEYAKVQQTLETVQADAAFASDTAQEAAISFKTLEASSKSVAIASINSMLLSARLGHARGPLSVLSAEVRETATKCLAAVGGSQASLNAMTSSVQDMQGNLETSSAALGQTVDALAGLTEQSEKRFVQIQTLSKRSGASSEGLLSLVEGVETALSAASMIGERLLSLAVQLEALPVDGAPDPAVFATIWDSYTMDEERIVHADCFAGNPDLEINEPEAGQISDDIDDLLF